jgi:DNA-directed RNA polymerase subunit RPC12/RpoP
MISIVLCQYCGWKFVGDVENSGLVELKNDTMSSKKYRCQGCGRGVVSRFAKDPQQEVDRKIEEEKMNQEKQNWIQENIDFRSKFLEEASE